VQVHHHHSPLIKYYCSNQAWENIEQIGARGRQRLSLMIKENMTKQLKGNKKGREEKERRRNHAWWFVFYMND